MKYIAAFSLLIISLQCYSQKYKSLESTITFFSEAPIEDIAAVNKKAESTFDESNSKITFTVPIDQFQFDKSLMQKHFNENYLESDKYPQAKFEGKVTAFNPDYSSQKAAAVGQLTIHGITKRVEINGIMEKNGNRLSIKSDFKILLEEYDIKKPKILWNTIAEEIEVKINFIYQRLGSAN